MTMAQREITEDQFSAHCDESLRQLAREVRRCDLTIYEIARLSGLSWRSVKKVSDGIPVRFDTIDRIKMVLERHATAIGN